jgi:diguanylate cyclase (GGDEF)-like protein
VIGSEMEVQDAGGRKFWARTSKVPLFDSSGAVSGVLGVAEDVTERKQFELQLQQMAHHDALTGLPNRAYLFELLEQALRRSTRYGGHVAVAYFDIDRFKAVNDTWGHEVGDRVIETVAARVRSAVRETDVVGRVGGDEFVMVSETQASPADMEVVAQRLIEATREPIVIREDLRLDLSTSVGIAFHRPGMAADALLALADQAMYTAKKAGRNRIAYA